LRPCYASKVAINENSRIRVETPKNFEFCLPFRKRKTLDTGRQ